MSCRCALGVATAGAFALDIIAKSSLNRNLNSSSLILNLSCKQMIRSIEEWQIGAYAGDDEDEAEAHVQEKSKKILEPVVEKMPAPIGKQIALTMMVMVMSLLSRSSKHIHPVLQSSSMKGGSRLFSNLMRQYSFSQSVVLVGIMSFTALMEGTVFGHEGIVAVGASLPFGELKVWALGKKISTSKSQTLPV